jgi:hypothetical protein
VGPALVLSLVECGGKDVSCLRICLGLCVFACLFGKEGGGGHLGHKK